ncbi:MAG: cupin domain-containing protein [Nocardioidaceae bacterium]|nr:cupin domain-containing protein [Nocardioidaceae bacterium]
MPSANRITTPVSVDEDLIEGRYAELDGYTVGFESYRHDVDPGPFFAGLPDDRCQCPHWGVVTSGQITFRWADHEETYVEGDAYYAGPGHLPLITAGTSVVEFSPTDALNATMEVVGRNLAEAGASA